MGSGAKKQRKPLFRSQQQYPALRGAGSAQCAIRRAQRATRCSRRIIPIFFFFFFFFFFSFFFFSDLCNQGFSSGGLHAMARTVLLHSYHRTLTPYSLLLAPQHRVLIHWQVHGTGSHLLMAAGGVQHVVFLLDLSNFQDTRKVA